MANSTDNLSSSLDIHTINVDTSRRTCFSKFGLVFYFKKLDHSLQ